MFCNIDYCYFETLLSSYDFFSTKLLNLILRNTNPSFNPFITVQRLLCQQSLLFEKSDACSSLLRCECAELSTELVWKMDLLNADGYCLQQQTSTWYKTHYYSFLFHIHISCACSVIRGCLLLSWWYKLCRC